MNTNTEFQMRVLASKARQAQDRAYRVANRTPAEVAADAAVQAWLDGKPR